MLWTVFLSTLKHQLLQNTGREFFNDSLYYTVMTEWLQDIFMWMNSKQIRNYAFVEETVTESDTAKQFETTYGIMGIVDEKYWDESNTGVKASNCYLRRKVFATNESFAARDWVENSMYEYTFLVDTSGSWHIKGIKTSETYDSIDIRYFREPIAVTSDTIWNHLDIPNILSRALRLYCMMELMPSPYLDTGANISEFYFARYREALMSYASMIGSSIDFSLVSR